MHALKTLTVLTVVLSVFFMGCGEREKPSSQSAPTVPAPAVSVAPKANQGIEIPLTFTGKSHGLNKKTSQVEVKDGKLKVTSTSMSDTHLVSEPLDLVAGQTYKITGMVKGISLLESSKGPNAAGISVLSEKIIVDFPSGTYDWKPFEGTFTLAQSGRKQIAVGIGAWKTGKGTLEVRLLKLYK